MHCVVLLVVGVTNAFSSAKVLRDGTLLLEPADLELKSTCPQEEWMKPTFPADQAKEAVTLWTKVFGTTAPTWLEAYALKCLEGYVEAPYHHRGHAVDVYRYWLRAFGTTKEMLISDIKAVAVGLLCHDYGHPGLNNKYMAAHHYAADKTGKPDKAGPTARAESIQKAIDAIDGADSSKWTEWMKSAGETDYEKRVQPQAKSLAGVAARASAGSFAVFDGAAGEDIRGMCAGTGGTAMDRHNEPAACERNPYCCFKGCYGGERGANGCWSIEESFHAMNAKKIFEETAGGAVKDGIDADVVANAILATDMGRDQSDRAELLDLDMKGKDVSMHLRGILIHLTDISGSSSEDHVCWSAGIHAEFKDQAYLITGSQPNAASVEGKFGWITAELGWARGVKLFLEKAFAITSVDKEGETFRKSRIDSITKYIAAIVKCKDRVAKEGAEEKKKGLFPALGTEPLDMQKEIMKAVRAQCPELTDM